VRLILERSPKPNQSDEGYLERIEVMIGGDRALHTMMFERDELDLVYLVQVPDLVRLSRVMTWKGTIRMIERAETDFLYLNTELPPFDEVKVRRAVNHAINKERLITLTAQSAVAARGILPPLMPGFNPEPKGLEFDPEKAKELLRDSGHAEGLVFDLWYTDDDPRWERAVFAIENDLRGVGITAKLKKVTYATLITAMQTRKRVACSFNGWGQDYPDPSNFLDVLFNGTRIQESGGNNLSYYNNAEVNRLLAEADRCFDLRERGRRYQGIEKIILQDAPVVPLMHTAAPMLVSEQVGGFKPHPVWQMRYERWWKANNSK
jgi:ABC-type transport system substrate-binding protein